MSTAYQLPSTIELPSPLPRHVKVTGHGPAYGFEPCEDVGCSVGSDGQASSCGRVACPACGFGGTNLSTIELLAATTQLRIRCSCGHSWLVAERRHFH